MLDFRIETFLAVCQTLNFTEAARLLNITQPAVSQHIHALEQQYQVQLIAFKGKKCILTQAGQVLFQMATSMQHDIDHFKEQIAQGNFVKRINFGATLTIGEYIMPGPLEYLLLHRQDIHVRMIVDNTNTLLGLMDHGEIDFAIIEGFFPRNAYDSLLFKTEHFVPVCSPEYRFSKQVCGLEDLLGERLFVRELGSGTREVLNHALREHNLSLEDFSHLTEIGNLNTIKSLVSSGIGISFFYESVVRKELDEGSLKEIELENFSVDHDFTFLWRAGSFFTSYYHELFELFQSAGKAAGCGADRDRAGLPEDSGDLL